MRLRADHVRSLRPVPVTSQSRNPSLEARRDFLAAVLSRAQDAPLDMRDEITASLHSALKCSCGITPDMCARYIEAWLQDLKHWKQQWGAIRMMPSVDAALAELGLVTTPADSPKRILHPQDIATLLPVSGRVAIPQFDTLRKIEQHYSAQRLTSPPDKVPSTIPWVTTHQRGRHRWRSRVVSIGHKGDLISTVHTTVIYCQIIAIRIFIRIRERARP